MARKTVSVEFVKNVANTALAAEKSTSEERRAIAFMVEAVLMETNTYKGFQYLGSEFRPAEATDLERGVHRVLRPGYDDTRRRYF